MDRNHSLLNRQFNKSLGFILISICATTAFAQDSIFTLGKFPLPPRVTISGTSGNNTFGAADAMFPLYGNTNQIFYTDVAAKAGDDSAWLASLGFGGRKILHNQAIFGGYLFGDYNRSPYANHFAVLNPGIEYITNEWDSHLNAYVPVGQKSYVSQSYTGSELGLNTTTFNGHTEYDAVFNLLEDVGPGADIEFGHTFSSFKRARVYVGGYFFAPQYTDNVTGIEAGFEMPLKYKSATLVAADSYDNVNQNTFVLTLRLSFGGLDKSGEPDIHDRMLDRIPRHLGNLYNGDGIPSERAMVNSGSTTIVRTNIWFFNADGTPSLIEGPQSCTYENPCFGLAQTQIDTINTLAPNANFYFSSGTYNSSVAGTGFSFYSGQNIFGRMPGFTQPATGNERPLINASLSLNGNNDVYNLRVAANSEIIIDSSGTLVPFHTGVYVTPAATGPVNIYNSDITTAATVLNAVGAINGSPTEALNIYNSSIASSVSNIPGGIAIGAANITTGMLNIANTTINVAQTDAPGNFDIAFGVVNNESGTVNITNSRINATSNNSGLTAAVLNNSTVGLGTININNTALSVSANNTFLVADVFNQANSGSGVSGTVNINRSTLRVSSLNNGGGMSAGVFNGGEGTVNLSSSLIASSGNEGTIAGIMNTDPLSRVVLQNNTIFVNFPTSTATGAPIINNGTVTDNGGNTCYLNGVKQMNC